MNIPDLLENIKLIEKLALENYNQRNGVVDYRLEGVCNLYSSVYNGNNSSPENGEVVLTCKVNKTVKAQLRYTFQVNGKRIAEKAIASELISLNALRP